METLGDILVAKSGKKVARNLNVNFVIDYMLLTLDYGNIHSNVN